LRDAASLAARLGVIGSSRPLREMTGLPLAEDALEHARLPLDE